jgi:hypothetical protein
MEGYKLGYKIPLQWIFRKIYTGFALREPKIEIDLVQATTSDDIVLFGAYFRANQRRRNRKVDTIVFFRADGGNFYGNLLLESDRLFVEQGVAFPGCESQRS